MTLRHETDLSFPQITISTIANPRKYPPTPYVPRSPDGPKVDMMNLKRQTAPSPAPPLTPTSPTSLSRPSSAAAIQRPRIVSDNSGFWLRGSTESDVQNVRVGKLRAEMSLI